MQAGRLQAVVELGTNPGGPKPPGHFSSLVDAGLFKYKNVLHGDLFAFHSHALGESIDEAAAVVAHTNGRQANGKTVITLEDR